MPSELQSHLLYWRGLIFIYDDPRNWKPDFVRLSCSELPERHAVSLTIASGEPSPECLSRFSSFDLMLQVVSWMRRLSCNCRHRKIGLTNILSRTELDVALRVVILASQRHFYAHLHSKLVSDSCVSSKPLARLCPFIFCINRHICCF